MSLLSVCAGDGDIASSVLTLFVIPIDRAFLSTIMSKNYINHIGTYNDHSKSITINGANANITDLVRQFMADDIEPVEEESEQVDSIIFTKKAKVEHKESYIIAALQKSVQGRKDKTRAFVQELHDWQNQAYVDAHFNARVMYDELEKLMPISFGYDGFKRLYNNSRN